MDSAVPAKTGITSWEQTGNGDDWLSCVGYRNALVHLGWGEDTKRDEAQTPQREHSDHLHKVDVMGHVEIIADV